MALFGPSEFTRATMYSPVARAVSRGVPYRYMGSTGPLASLAVSRDAAHMMPQISNTSRQGHRRMQSGAEQAVDAVECLFG